MDDQAVLIILILLAAGLAALTLLTVTQLQQQPVPTIVPEPPKSSSSSPSENVHGVEPSTLTGRSKEITCMVVVPEFIFGAPVDDPAVETAIIRELLQANFRVVDQDMIDQIRYKDETLLAAYGTSYDALTALRALSLEYDADVLIVGHALTEGQIPAPGGLISTRAWAEVRAVDTRTGQIFAADQTAQGGADLTIQIAARKALENAGSVLGKSTTQALEKRFGIQAGTQDKVELIIVGMPIDAYITFKQKLQYFPYIKQVIADHYTADEAHITFYYSHADLIDLVNYLRQLKLDGGRLEVLTYSFSRVTLRYER